MSSSRLRYCEECHQAWPRTPDHDLRGFGWLDPLPRRISLSNADLLLHDGVHGPDRFLFVEAKMPWEPALQKGQNWLLSSLARIPRWTVRILSGRLDKMKLHRVTSEGVEREGTLVTPASFRDGVAAWLNGQQWQDPKGQRDAPKMLRHTCGWQKVEGVWRCLQDYYAVGDAPETACEAVWQEGA